MNHQKNPSEPDGSQPKQQTEKNVDEQDILSIIDFIFNSTRPPTIIEIAVGTQMPEKRADYLVDILVRSTGSIEPTNSWKIMRDWDPVGYKLTLLGKHIADRNRAA